MAILVLGGAGYIGSHTVHALLEEGADVVVADNLSTGHKAAVNAGARFYEGDICDRDFICGLLQLESIDSVIHFAASSLVGESMQNPLKYYRNNLCGTEALLECLVEHGVNKIVFSSSAAVYGQPGEIPISEDSPALPTNPYGETKLAMERMFKWTAAAGEIRYVALRYFNACGAHPDGMIGEAHYPETHLIPIVLQTALGRRASLDIFGGDYPTRDGTCIRDYIHVCDLAAAHILALRYLENGGESEIFNLGIGKGFSNLEITHAAQRVSGRQIPYEIKARRAGDPSVLIASGQKARDILGWSPLYTQPEQMIQTALHWHENHPNGYGD